MTLRAIDLNLLPILRALLHEASVNRAAVVLGMSQPAVSHALKRLRHLVKDPLLVRVGNATSLTPRAEQLRALVDQSCAGIETILAEEAFDPSEASRTFVVTSSDYSALLVARELLPVLRKAAPGIQVHFVDTRADVRDLLHAGKIDLLIGTRVPELLDGLSVHGGLADDLVCVVPPGHALASRRGVTVEALRGHRRLTINLAPQILLEERLGPGAEQVRIAPSHLLVLPLLVATGDEIAIVPRALARLAHCYAPVHILDIEDANERLEICMSWSPVRAFDRGHTWLRTQIEHILSHHFQPFAP